MDKGAMLELAARLRELLAKATEGPWGFDERYDGGPCHVWAPSRELAMDGGPMRYVDRRADLADLRKENARANAALIVEAVNALPALLDALASQVDHAR